MPPKTIGKKTWIPGRECVPKLKYQSATGATTTEAHRHSVAFRGGGLMVWWVVAYCGSPLKYSTVSASAGPNTALYASPNFGDA